jgi:hypothetical protein
MAGPFKLVLGLFTHNLEKRGFVAAIAATVDQSDMRGLVTA